MTDKIQKPISVLSTQPEPAQFLAGRNSVSEAKCFEEGDNGYAITLLLGYKLFLLPS
jgi:hypothetical protein